MSEEGDVVSEVPAQVVTADVVPEKLDAFEAALAASATEIASPPAAEPAVEATFEPSSSPESELALSSDEDGDI